MVVSCRILALASFPQEIVSRFLLNFRVWWAPELLWEFCIGEKFLTDAGNETRFRSPSVVF